ncbi:DUF7507 domain-containing protein [Myroides sp. LJL110]
MKQINFLNYIRSKLVLVVFFVVQMTFGSSVLQSTQGVSVNIFPATLYAMIDEPLMVDFVIRNESSVVVNNLQVQINYNAGYDVISSDTGISSQVNIWNAGSLQPGETKIGKVNFLVKVEGNLELAAILREGSTTLSTHKVEVMRDYGDLCGNATPDIAIGSHATLVKTKTGFKIWGPLTGPKGSSYNHTPTEIVPSKGYNYEGAPLHATVGGASGGHYLLTTKGLYTWGEAIVDANTRVGLYGMFSALTGEQGEPFFTKVKYWPSELEPKDIKFLRSSVNVVAMVTHKGEVYIYTNNLYLKADQEFVNVPTTYGDKWHKVLKMDNTPLTGVESLDLGVNYAYALTKDDELYTWGEDVFDGRGSHIFTMPRAFPMKKPPLEGKIAMITSAGSGKPSVTNDYRQTSYYVLDEASGIIYALGSNGYGQLSQGANYEEFVFWVPIKKTTGQDMNNVVFINGSAGNTDTGFPSLGIVNKNGEIFTAGNNEFGKLGLPVSTLNAINLSKPKGTQGRKFSAIYMGGSLSLAIDENSTRYGYAGQQAYGSMGAGPIPGLSDYYPYFNFEDTAEIQELCALYPQGELELIKYGEYQDTNKNGRIDLGDQIIYRFTLTNKTDRVLSNIEILDPKLSEIKKDQPLLVELKPNEIYSGFYGVYPITRDDIDRQGVYNLATVTAKDESGFTFSNISRSMASGLPSDPGFNPECSSCTFVELQGNSLVEFTKQGELIQSDLPRDAYVGQRITFTFKASNIGEKPLRNVVITDNLLGVTLTSPLQGDTNNNNILDVGETWLYKADKLVTLEDIQRGAVYNIARFTAEENDKTVYSVMSVDPNPVDPNTPGHPGVDPDCPTCTIVLIDGVLQVISNSNVYQRVL